ncbi:DDE-type integrase/transposase/recombinase [Pseudomonas plecoglossicida]|uniref:DDE-type integrase/transposase/recombinase n=1 Tax=Pseudomonas plecoglossicida TaxID=70775 RepID=UPI0035BF4A3E
MGWGLSEKQAQTSWSKRWKWHTSSVEPQGLLFHSDHGSQYGSRQFRQRLWRYRMRHSMSCRGNCWDNAPRERVFRSLKSGSGLSDITL